MGLFGKARGLFSTPQFTEKLAAIGGTLRDDDGGRSAYAYQALQERRRQEEQQAQQQQQAREFDWQDWVRKQQYQRENPMPANNDTVSDYNFIAQTIGKDAADQYLRNMGDPMVMTPLPNGSMYSGPRSGLGRALQGGAPSRPVGKLTPIPDTPTMQNTPSPELGANGLPTRLTSQQYQAIVAQKGAAATADWARRNNIMVGN